MNKAASGSSGHIGMSNLPGSTKNPLAPELVIRELDAILASPSFKNSGRLSRFLRYIVGQSLEGHAEDLKEYRVGLEVFERGPDYDTRIDPVVRVEARQLRFKLAKYYATFGAADEIVIGLPKGHYAPCFERRLALPSEAEESGGVGPDDRANGYVNPDVVPEGNLERAPAATRGPLRRKAPLLAAVFGVFVVVALFLTLREPIARWVKASGKSPVTRRATNPEAEALYLKGRYYWNKRTLEGLNQAVDCFTQSIVKDPGYALAYAGLADAYNLLSEYTVMPYREAFTRAIAAANKAVELDDSLSNAHASLAFASFWGAWDPAAAEREFKRALELNPNYVVAHHWYATFLLTRGRFREALAEIEHAQQQDPTSTSILADKGLILAYGGQRDLAIALLKQIEASEPSFLSTHNYLASIYLEAGRYPEYLSEYKNMAVLSHDPEALDLVAAGQKGFAAGGSRGMLVAMLKAQEKFSSSGRPSNYDMAKTCSLLGEKRRALAYLEAALYQRETGMLVLRVDTALNALHGEAAFQDLLKRVGLPPLN
jgi:tetratricopeptide (TPR) repeat protein